MSATGRPADTRPARSDEARISAIVLTLNESAHIVPCLRTLRWTDEQVVVDSGSVDETAALAAAMGARVVRRDWDGWPAQRNFGIAQARHPWVLFVDADERVTLDLADEIRREVAAASAANVPGEPAGFRIPRQNLILGRWMRDAGWSPDYQTRLFRAARGRYDLDRPVHELVTLDGPSKDLQHRLVHHNYVSWRQFWSKQKGYARMEAARLWYEGRRARPRHLVVQPLREFRRRYLTLGGYRAGMLGLQLSAVLAAADCLTYAELRRLEQAARLPGRGRDPQ